MSIKKLLFGVFCILLCISMLVSPMSVFADDVTTSDGGDQAEPEEITYAAMDLLNTDLSKYISLGEHKDVPITLDVYVTDEMLYDFAVESNVYTEIKTRESAVGDIINISYVGNVKLSNGSLLPVQGGSGSGMIELGKAPEKTEKVIEYLMNREELVGVMPGKTAEISITFPEDFSEEAMAGREIIFTVTVEAIVEYGFTDSYVSTKYGCKNVEEFRELLIQYNLTNFHSELKYEIFLTITKNSKVLMYPEEQYNYYYYAMYNTYKSKYDDLCKNDSSYASETSFEKYLENNGLTLADIEESAKVSTEQDLVYFAIYKSGAVGTMTEADYSQLLADLASGYGTTSAELETLFAGKHDLMNVIVSNFVYNKIEELAIVTTDYDEFKHLLEVATTTPPTQGTTAPGNAEAAPCGVDITSVVIIAVLAIGAAVFIALLFIKKKEPSEDESEEYEDDEYEDDEYEEDEYEEDEEYDEEPDDEDSDENSDEDSKQ